MNALMRLFPEWHPAAVWGVVVGFMCFGWFLWLVVKGGSDKQP